MKHLPLFIFIVMLFGCAPLRADQEAGIRNAAGTTAEVIGIPRPIGEGLAAVVLYAVGHLIGHRHGKKAAKTP